VSWFRHRGARENLHGENGGKGRFIYLDRALDRSFDPDYIRDEGRERELECYISCFIVDTCQNCDWRHACVLAAAAPAAVKLLKLP